jgi:hypothetical protein
MFSFEVATTEQATRLRTVPRTSQLALPLLSLQKRVTTSLALMISLSSSHPSRRRPRQNRLQNHRRLQNLSPSPQRRLRLSPNQRQNPNLPKATASSLHLWQKRLLWNVASLWVRSRALVPTEESLEKTSTNTRLPLPLLRHRRTRPPQRLLLLMTTSTPPCRTCAVSLVNV